MLTRLIDIALARRQLVVALTVLVASMGVWSLLRLPMDAVPDITDVQVQVNSEIKGLLPEDVERQVTWPIESAMSGIPGLRGTRSLSRNGFSQVTALFRDGIDLVVARQQVAERLAQAREHLPPGTEPRLGPVATGLGEVLFYSVGFIHPEGVKEGAAPSGQPGWQADGTYRTPEGDILADERQRLTWLRTLQDWVIAPQLRGTPGVADVDALGGWRREFVVMPDPARLVARGVTLRDVSEGLERGNRAVGAGAIERFGESYVVRVEGRSRGTADLAAIPLGLRGGVPVLVADVATVADGSELRSGSASRDGRETVTGTVLMLVGANARLVADAAARRLTEINAGLPADVQVTVVLNRRTLVDIVVRTVGINLAEGAALVAVVLFVLLGNLRGALICALAIPLSMLVAAIGMERLGISGNLMSLGAIDFGIIVDTAVIIVENALRRLAVLQQSLGRPLDRDERLAEVAAATREMVRPAVYGQLIIILVYVPVLMLTGIEGRMFRPMAATVILALAGAFVLSLTLVPALVALVVRGPVATHDQPASRWAKAAYAPLVDLVVRWRLPVVTAAVVVLAGATWLFTRLGAEFIPTLDEGNFAFEAMRMPSIGVDLSTAMQLRVEQALIRLPEVSTVLARTGTAELAFDPMPWNTSDTIVMLKPRAAWPDPGLSRRRLRTKLADAVEEQLGTRAEFSQPIELRFNELLAGVRSDVAVRVFADDFARSLPTAQRVAEILAKVPGATGIKVESVEGAAAWSVIPNRARLARLGIPLADVQDVVATAVGGRESGLIFTGDRRFPVVVRLDERLRNDPTELQHLPVPVPTRDGEGTRQVMLGDVARFAQVTTTNQISRDDGQRRVIVQCNVRNRDLVGFVEEARKQVAALVPMPSGCRLSWGGQYEHYEEARSRLAILVPVCGALILILLYAALSSTRLALLVFTAVPFALTGGIVALWLRGLPFSISAAIGFIALSGVAVLNGLVLVTCIEQLRRAGQPLDQAIATGCQLRLRPVLMTALVASLGFIPMALSQGQGAEVQRPLATVVIGGIISSTLLTLVVVPALYRLVHRVRRAT